MQSQLSDLLDEVDELKARESMYKQQMEKKTCDLHKAETEVSLYFSSIFTIHLDDFEASFHKLHAIDWILFIFF